MTPSVVSRLFSTQWPFTNNFLLTLFKLDPSRGGVYKKFGCDAILCPSGTYNVIGMQDSEMNACDSCPGSLYLGATSCNTTDSLIPVDDLELLASDVVQEKKALSIFYHKCGG